MKKNEEFLEEVYPYLKPGYISYKFGELLNLCLVLIKVKKGAIISIDDKYMYEGGKEKFENIGLCVEKIGITYKNAWIISNEIFILNDLNLNKDEKTIKIGKILGFMTPFPIGSKKDIEKYGAKCRGVHIMVEFVNKKYPYRKNNAQLCPQIIVDKTRDEIVEEYMRYVNGVKELKFKILNEFKIKEIKIDITNNFYKI